MNSFYFSAGSKQIESKCMNSLFAIAPYKFQGFWVFDDPAVGLRQEPFVSGADTIIDVLTANIPDAANGFGTNGPKAAWKAGFAPPSLNTSKPPQKKST